MIDLVQVEKVTCVWHDIKSVELKVLRGPSTNDVTALGGGGIKDFVTIVLKF